MHIFPDASETVWITKAAQGEREEICVTSQVAQWVKNPTANAGDTEMQVRSLGGEDPLEKKMANHSSILAWRIPWTEEPGGLQSMGFQRTECTCT